VAALAVACLARELATWPKPGLVSHVDAGSHADMDAGTFRRSAAALRPHLAALAEAGRAGAGMARLRAIGVAAEADMMAATGGVNTHRGAIFGLGLLCAAAGHASRLPGGGEAVGRPALGPVVARLWGPAILDGPVPLRSHGTRARRLYRAGGARAEAAAGFPTLHSVGLPALAEGRRLAPGDEEAARVHCCFALVAALEDTNLLHRGGPAGLAEARRAAGAFLAAGGVGAPGWRDRAAALHRTFVARRLSPGGSADLLAMTLFVDAWEARP
jgi:triphosphoribosyl-dephospho-CoA synthase